MTPYQVHLKPTVSLRFTEQELALLLICARRHYDFDTRMLAAPGGILHTIRFSYYGHDHPGTFDPLAVSPLLTLRQIDALSKVVEFQAGLKPEDEALRAQLFRSFGELHGRLNTLQGRPSAFPVYEAEVYEPDDGMENPDEPDYDAEKLAPSTP